MTPTTNPTPQPETEKAELASQRWPDLRVSEVESMRNDANLFNHYWLNVHEFAHRTGATAGTDVILWLREFPKDVEAIKSETALLKERVRVLEGALEEICDLCLSEEDILDSDEFEEEVFAIASKAVARARSALHTTPEVGE